MTLQQRIEKVRSLENQVREHCMCVRFIVEGSHYTVIYPEGMKLGGAQIAKGNNKAKALKKLLNAMERHWNDEQLLTK